MLWDVDDRRARGLGDQIAGNVRRAVGEGTLVAGERLPPATELAEALGVNSNTVLAAYRRLREEGLLEFRRGRGVRVRHDATVAAMVHDAARHLLEVGRTHGYRDDELAELVTNLGIEERRRG